jgi:hypothetical protein
MTHVQGVRLNHTIFFTRECSMDKSVLRKTVMLPSTCSQRLQCLWEPSIPDTVCTNSPPSGLSTLVRGLGNRTLRRKIPCVHLVPLNVGDEFQHLVPSFDAAFHARMAAWRMDGKPRTARRFTV